MKERREHCARPGRPCTTREKETERKYSQHEGKKEGKEGQLERGKGVAWVREGAKTLKVLPRQ